MTIGKIKECLEFLCGNELTSARKKEEKFHPLIPKFALYWILWFSKKLPISTQIILDWLNDWLIYWLIGWCDESLTRWLNDWWTDWAIDSLIIRDLVHYSSIFCWWGIYHMKRYIVMIIIIIDEVITVCHVLAWSTYWTSKPYPTVFDIQNLPNDSCWFQWTSLL